MERRFETPHVVEIGPHGTSKPVRPSASKPSQRTQVEASLLRRPERGPDARA